ncbi:hypothetical protein ACJIZ3_018123 [Penstemon smallii]|uniref:EF-hand domain-containing protein n=1 Tax=Penstemon smallii TaxID=265156 RepID=A0ABD3SY26_9LAMI
MCPTGTDETKSIRKSNLRSAFDVLDVDGDGKISYDDLQASYGGFNSGLEASEEDVIGSMIYIADANRNGYVEYDEFEKAVLMNGGKGKGKGKNNNNNVGMRIGVMEDAFRVMDKDGDGKVGHEDLKSYLNWAGFEAHDEDVKAMIRLGGGDLNGGVTFEGLLKILAF